MCTSHRNNGLVPDVIEIRCHANHSGSLRPKITCDTSVQGSARRIYAELTTATASGQ